MNYPQSREYIKDCEKYAGELSLVNIRNLMERLGNPQDSLRFIHVSGTNGKGSVIAYMYEVLREAGYRVGRYISPSVYTYREKMEVNGVKVTREEFAGSVTVIKNTIDQMTQEGLAHPTPFEVETAAAFLFFAEKQCDIVLLEVGMGGRDDATNLIKTTELAVLMPISLEHQDWLGKTLAEITEKKAGIIKPGCHVITAPQEAEALDVIRQKAFLANVPVTTVDLAALHVAKENIFGQSFVYKNEKYDLSLSGVYQTENAAAAVEALHVLQQRGFSITEEQIKTGLKKTRWDGRLTVLKQNPLFLVDGAHNPAAALALENSIRKYLKDKKLYFIMGVFADKDYHQLISRMCGYAEEIFAIETPGHPRALPAEKLAEAIREVNPHAQACKDIETAVQKALAAAGTQDAVLAFGSLSFLGELTEIVKRLEEEEK